jgi:hypothetical protein
MGVAQTNPRPDRWQIRPKLSQRIARRVFYVYWFAILGGTAAVLVLSYVGRVRFQWLVDQKHRQGESVVLADFQPRSVPVDADAAIPLTRAAEMLSAETEPDWLDDLTSYEWMKHGNVYARCMIRDYPQAFALIRHARTFQSTNWGIPLTSPVLETHSSRYLSDQRRIARELYAIALFQHDRGNDAEAVEGIRDILTISRALRSQPTDISNLVAEGVDCLASDLAMRIATTLCISDGSADVQATGANRSTMKALVDELLDDAGRRSALKESLQWQRMDGVDAVEHLGKEYWFYRFSVMNWEAIQMLNAFDEPLVAATCENWPAADAQQRKAPAVSNKFVLASSFSGTRDRPVLQFFWCMTWRRAAATTLALRTYAVDHDANWPANLSELVPGYLACLPADPFAASGQPLKYIAGSPPAVYSVGKDGIDNHGDRTGSMTHGTYNPLGSPDTVFPVGGVLVPADQRPSPMMSGRRMAKTATAN